MVYRSFESVWTSIAGSVFIIGILVKHPSFTHGLTEAWCPPLKHLQGMAVAVSSLDQGSLANVASMLGDTVQRLLL